MRSADLDPIDAAFDDVKRFSRHEPLGFRVRPPPHGFGRGNDRPSNSTTDAPLDARSRAAVLPAGPAPTTATRGRVIGGGTRRAWHDECGPAERATTPGFAGEKASVIALPDWRG